MTPNQLETARRLVGAEWWEWHGPANRSDALRRLGVRDGARGHRWVWDEDGHRWIPDLTDGGTAGVLLGAIAAELRVVVVESEIHDGRSHVAVQLRGDDDDGPYCSEVGDTLAHAAALALLEVRGG